MSWRGYFTTREMHEGVLAERALVDYGMRPGKRGYSAATWQAEAPVEHVGEIQHRRIEGGWIIGNAPQYEVIHDHGRS